MKKLLELRTEQVTAVLLFLKMRGEIRGTTEELVEEYYDDIVRAMSMGGIGKKTVEDLIDKKLKKEENLAEKMVKDYKSFDIDFNDYYSSKHRKALIKISRKYSFMGADWIAQNLGVPKKEISNALSF